MSMHSLWLQKLFQDYVVLAILFIDFTDSFASQTVNDCLPTAYYPFRDNISIENPGLFPRDIVNLSDENRTWTDIRTRFYLMYSATFIVADG